jgi:endo-1,4-beta-xylanase
LSQTDLLSQQLAALEYQDRNFRANDEKPLKQQAILKKLLYGGASSYQELRSDKKFASVFERECGILFAQEDLMWANVQPQANTFVFEKGDWLANFARDRNMLFAATHLVWYNFMPKWFEETANKQNIKQLLLKHIEKVVGHYAGKVQLWSVVNEAVSPHDGRTDGLRNTKWLEALGPDYIEMSFRAAAEADPNALLFYNDYGIEFDSPEQEARRTGVLKLLERLVSRQVPIHALGVQSHIWYDLRFKPKKLRAFLRDVADLGLKILISELDVIDKSLPKQIPIRDRIVAGVYEDYLSVVLEEPAVMAVVTWGLSDRYTWHSWNEPRQDGAPVRPLPLDVNLNRKMAWHAIARSFDKMSVRRRSPMWKMWNKL